MHERPTGDAPGDPTRLDCCASTAARASAPGRRRSPSQGSLADIAAFTPNGRWLVTVERERRSCPPPKPARAARERRSCCATRARCGRCAPSPGSRSPARSRPAGARSPPEATTARCGSSTCAPGGHAPPQGATTPPVRNVRVHARTGASSSRSATTRRSSSGTSRRHGGRDVRRSLRRYGRARREPRRPPGLHGGGRRNADHLGPRGERRLGRPFEVGAHERRLDFLERRSALTGATLAMQQADGTISLVDLATLPRRGPFASRACPDTGGTPYAPAFGPHGTLVVSGVDGLLALADETAGASWSALRGHRDIVFTPTASPDGASSPARRGRDAAPAGTPAPAASSARRSSSTAERRATPGSARTAGRSRWQLYGGAGRRLRRPLPPATRGACTSTRPARRRALLARRPDAARAGAADGPRALFSARRPATARPGAAHSAGDISTIDLSRTAARS